MTPPTPGTSETLSPGLRRILAPNPGPMTHWGTNTYILGEGQLAVIDPGPASDAHLAAIQAATQGETITHVIVTHAHADHSPMSRALAEATGAPIIGYGRPEAGRSEIMTQLSNAGLSGGGEGLDNAFLPNQCVSEGDRIEGEGWALDVLHTPGHFSGHLAFAFEDTMFTGDHVMDWASSLVSPPDGDLGAFMQTSRRLIDSHAMLFHTGHGAPIEDPTDRLGWLIEHRKTRETAILNALSKKPQSIEHITKAVYTDIPQQMLPAAARNVFAHLIDLVERNHAKAQPELGLRATFSRT